MWIPVLASLVTATLVAAPKAQPKLGQPRSVAATADAGPFAALPEPALRDALAAMGEATPLEPKAAKAVQAVVDALRAGDEAGALEAWAMVIELQPPQARRATEMMALAGLVLRRAYLETTADLAGYAERVSFFNALRKRVRDALRATREAVAAAAAAGAKVVEVPSLLVRTEFAAGRSPVLARTMIEVDLTEARARIRKLEEVLQTVGDDAQLANIDLQDALQKQQQTLQTMSSISKMLHDTALAVIRKIGGG
jgi:hypothetical protein